MIDALGRKIASDIEKIKKTLLSNDYNPAQQFTKFDDKEQKRHDEIKEKLDELIKAIESTIQPIQEEVEMLVTTAKSKTKKKKKKESSLIQEGIIPTKISISSKRNEDFLDFFGKSLKKYSKLTERIINASKASSGGSGKPPSNNSPTIDGVNPDDFFESIKENFDDFFNKTLTESEKNLAKSADKIQAMLSIALGGTDVFGLVTAGITKLLPIQEELKGVAFRLEGISYKNSVELQDQFAIITDRMNKTVARTGKTSIEFQERAAKEYNKIYRSNIKIEKLLESSLNLSTMIGVASESTVDLFRSWNTELSLSTEQLDQVSKSIQQVQKYTKITGDALLENVKASEKFLQKMRIAGTLTSNSIRNVIMLQTEASKLGIAEKITPVLDALSSTTSFFEADSKIQGLLANVSNIADQNRIAGGVNLKENDFLSRKLPLGTLLQSRKDIEAFAKAFGEYGGKFAGLSPGKSLTEAEVKNLSPEERMQRNLAFKAATGFELDEFARQYEALSKASKSYVDRLREIDKQLGKNITNEERNILLSQKASMNFEESFNALTKISENTALFDVGTGSIQDVMNKIKEDLSESGFKDFKNDILTISESLKVDESLINKAKMGDDIDLTKLIASSSYKSLSQKAKAVNVKIDSGIEDKLNKAISNNDLGMLNDAISDMNLLAKEITTKESTTKSPIEEMANNFREYNRTLLEYTSRLGTILNFLGGTVLTGTALGLSVISTMLMSYGGIKFISKLGLYLTSVMPMLSNLPKIFESRLDKFTNAAKNSRSAQGLSTLTSSITNSSGTVIGTSYKQNPIVNNAAKSFFTSIKNDYVVFFTNLNKFLFDKITLIGNAFRTIGGFFSSYLINPLMTLGSEILGPIGSLLLNYFINPLMSLGSKVLKPIGSLLLNYFINPLVSLARMGPWASLTAGLGSFSTILTKLSRFLLGPWATLALGLYSIGNAAKTAGEQAGEIFEKSQVTATEKMAAQNAGFLTGIFDFLTFGLLSSIFGPTGILTTWIAKIFNAVPILTYVFNVITSIFMGLSDIVNSLFSGIWEGIKESFGIVGEFFNIVFEPFYEIASDIAEIFGFDITKITGDFNIIFTVLSEVGKILGGIIKTFIVGFIEPLIPIAKLLASTIKFVYSFFKLVYNLLTGDFKEVTWDIYYNFLDILENAIMSILMLIKAMPIANIIWSTVKTLGDYLLKMFTGIFSSLHTVLIKPFVNLGTWLYDKLTNVFSSILDKLWDLVWKKDEKTNAESALTIATKYSDNLKKYRERKNVDLKNENVLPMADGGEGIIKKPTLMLVGEAGPEYVNVKPLDNPFVTPKSVKDNIYTRAERRMKGNENAQRMSSPELEELVRINTELAKINLAQLEIMKQIAEKNGGQEYSFSKPATKGSKSAKYYSRPFGLPINSNNLNLA